ncbi:hypothetical protein M6B22_10450 [Jatrophihabitans cynanchi]|uniref:Uncharacterized protein n=1 Tax=Jatrophihabitans cynanchi TaxID=2944128 RepID=A0ABY7K5L9_9ACTN|nr:hypothetical protein [Jatrophihabitans sp. SB3-54]WAX59158.1 hypothetical protein M6B22_10450 [Jatrophihabitans sp. SB3-54]
MTNRSSRPARTAPPSRSGSGAARRKAAAFRAAEAARQRRLRVLRWGGSVALVAAAVTVIVVLALSGGGGHHGSGASAASSDTASATLTGPPGPEGIVLEEGTPLAPASTAATGQTTDGVQCNSMEQAVYHIHTHLTVYVNGALRPIPAGIGVVEPVAQQGSRGTFDEASRCYYWLHTHAQDGIIHVEAPSHATYTLGQFFGIWHQTLGPHQVGPATGNVTTYVNGKRYTGDPASITLTSHEDIQLDLGTPTVAPRRVDWSHAQL